jgi:hypothetical protein
MHGAPHSRSGAGTPSRPEGAPAYHPEFGYLFPSVAVRQQARAAMISAGIGILIGVGIALTLMERQSARSQRGENPLTSEAADQALATSAFAVDSPTRAPAANRDSASRSSDWDWCKNGGDFFLIRECHSIRKRKARASRLIAAQSAALEARAHATVETGRPLAGGDSSRPTEDRPAESTTRPATTPAWKPAKNRRARARSREPKGDPAKAFAYASPPYAQYYRNTDTYRGRREAQKANWGWSWCGGASCTSVDAPRRKPSN